MTAGAFPTRAATVQPSFPALGVSPEKGFPAVLATNPLRDNGCVWFTFEHGNFPIGTTGIENQATESSYLGVHGTLHTVACIPPFPPQLPAFYPFQTVSDCPRFFQISERRNLYV